MDPLAGTFLGFLQFVAYALLLGAVVLWAGSKFPDNPVVKAAGALT